MRVKGLSPGVKLQNLGPGPESSRKMKKPMHWGGGGGARTKMGKGELLTNPTICLDHHGWSFSMVCNCTLLQLFIKTT